LLEDKEKNTPNGECQTDILSFLLSTDFEEMGVFHGMQWDVGHPCSLPMEEKSLNITKRQPTNSTKCLAAHMGTSQASVHGTQQEQRFYPHHIHSVQESVPHDAPAMDFATDGGGPYVYSQGFIHRQSIFC
jgi:hypothetical protein